MKDFLEKNKIWILGFLYLITVFLFWNYFFIPNLQKIEKISDQIQEKILDKEILENRLSGLSKMQEKSDLFSQKKSDLGHIIENSQEVLFIRYLEDLAHETGNEISIEIPEEIEKKGKKTVNIAGSGDEIAKKLKYNDFFLFKINLIGNFENSFKFIKMLENSVYYSNVVAISMEKKEKKESHAQSVFSSSENENNGGVGKEYLKTELKLIVYANEPQN